MTIFLNILFLIIGMVLLIKGADFFVDGASAVAKKFKVSPLIIGLTIVSIGTSLPELSISITSAISGSSDLTLGNVVGSNLVNMLLILGISALFCKMKLSKNSTKIELPLLFAITLIFLMFILDGFFNGESNILNRTDSIILLILFILYIYIIVKTALIEKKEQTSNQTIQEDTTDENFTQTILPDIKSNQGEIKPLKTWQIIIYLVLGLAAVVFGGECVCTTSQFLALKLGMSEALVGLTIVAVGTSLPELVTSIIAARKNESDIAIGNVIGSSIGNIGLILGMAGVIRPAQISNSILTDAIILFAATTFFTLFLAKKKETSKTFGAILIVIYVLYLAFAIVRNYCF